MPAESAGAVNVETETTSEQTGEEQKPSSFTDALLKEARELGHIIGEPVRTQPSEPEVQETSEPEPEEEPEQVVAEQETEPEEETEVDGRKPIDDQLKDYAAKGEKPPWYLSRISEETHKKNERTRERDKAIELAKAQEAEIQALRAQQTAPPPDTSNPVLNCWNETDIQNLARDCNKWIVWATKNPNGGEAVIGKDDKGDDIIKEIDADQSVALKLAAEKTLREGIPGRRDFLASRYQAEHIAAEVYPEFKNQDSVFSREVNALLTDPAVRYLSAFVPDIKVWVGHAVRGRTQFLAERNGSSKKTAATSKIVESVRTKAAPSVPKTRGFIPRNAGVDLDKATKTLKEKGTQEAAEEWLAARWANKGQSKKVERVEA